MSDEVRESNILEKNANYPSFEISYPHESIGNYLNLPFSEE
jgi:hypothetical protein